MRILIGDDYPVVRRGLIDILAAGLEDAEFGEAENGPQVLAQVRKEHWDIVVLDISMPGKSGLEVLKDIKSAYPDLPVLVLSVHPESHYARRALKAGASCYLTKESALVELRDAVRCVLAGGKYVSASLGEELAAELAGERGQLPHERLSDREYEVMRLVASGKTVKEIADELSLSVKTVNTYRARMLRKLGATTNAGVTRYAVEKGLVD